MSDRSEFLTVRLTGKEVRALERLLAKRTADLERATGMGLTVSASALVRTLLAKEAEQRGVEWP